MSKTCLGSDDHKHDSSLEMTLLFQQSGKRYQNLWKYYSVRVQPVTWILALRRLQEEKQDRKD